MRGRVPKAQNSLAQSPFKAGNLCFTKRSLILLVENETNA